jgi:acetyl-CoA acetyltransferase
MLAGLPDTTAALTINRFCSSGLQAIALAAGEILTGGADIVVAGGVESMSMVPMTGNKLSASPEAMERVAAVYTPMGITAENVAKRFNISRTEQDEFALASQLKASAAIKDGKFKDEIVNVHGVRYDGQNRILFDFAVDEMPRPATPLEALAALRPVFAKDGTLLWASHAVGPDVPVIAVNTAPRDSVGFFCAGTRDALGDVLARGAVPNAALLDALLGACLASCSECAKECDKHAKTGMAHCGVCAEACRACHKACKQLKGVAHA